MPKFRVELVSRKSTSYVVEAEDSTAAEEAVLSSADPAAKYGEQKEGFDRFVDNVEQLKGETLSRFAVTVYSDKRVRYYLRAKDEAEARYLLEDAVDTDAVFSHDWMDGHWNIEHVEKMEDEDA